MPATNWMQATAGQSQPGAAGGNTFQAGAAGGMQNFGPAQQNYNATPGWATNPNSQSGFTTPGMQYGLGPQGAIQGSVNNPTLNTGQISAGAVPVTSVGSGNMYQQQMEDAFYGQGQRRLDPQFAERQSQLESQLANQGLQRGTEAWTREMDRLGRDRNDAYQNLQSQATLTSGAEAQRMHGMALQGGTFANNAQNQGFQQSLQSQSAQNAALGQQFGQNLAAGQFGNAAQNQGFGQDLAAAGLNNAALLGQGQIAASRYGADQGLAGAQASASVGAESNRLREQQQNYDMAWGNQFNPVELQNRQMAGMYPTGMPQMPNFQTPGSPGQGNYFQSGLSQYGANQNSGYNWGNLVGAGLDLGGRVFNSRGSPNQYTGA